MDFKLKVIANQSAIQKKSERTADNQVRQTDVKTSRVILRGDNSSFQFATDYETGKKFELDREVTLTVPD